ncbi:uroporphyrinogen-III synthase [Spiribacter sp. 1M153]|uniref:uroporphyrinogen-III synthase n=1 Tax=Spiribacter roseus TaxID=1855875 RepID=UPI00349F628E
MMTKIQPQPFEGYRIAILETRQATELAGLLERRGAVVEYCALIGIKPTPDTDRVDRWLKRFINDHTINDLVILTGEAIRRLHDRAQLIGMDTALRDRLAAVNLLTRGPKPGRALRQWGLSETTRSDTPTTDGVIRTLTAQGVRSSAVGLALYGTEPNLPLQNAIKALGAEPVPVWPYVYTDHNDEYRAKALVGRIISGEVDAIIFSTKRQADVLMQISQAQGAEQSLRDALAAMTVGAMGPVVENKLRSLAIHVDAAPAGRYFMRPLTDALARAMAAQ